jgi:phosphoglucosamine mutase
MSNGRKLFGTDGMRGVANVEPMTGGTVMRLGMAIAARLRQPGRHTRIAIGKDTRLSGYMFESALAAGIVQMGADVWLTGPLPTPGIAFITSSMRCDAGVVISASHNPYEDNGIKVFARDGYKLPDQVEAEIETLMTSPTLDAQRAPSGEVGYNRRLEDARGRYIVYCKATFPSERTLDGLRIVVDGAHGAGYRVGPAVFEELGAKVFAIHTKPDGKNINARAGALYPQAMCEAVKLHDAHLGIAFDGDGDRCVLCDEHGNVVDGDAVMALCATRMLRAGTLAKNTLVATVMSNIGLERAIREHKGNVVRTQVGDRGGTGGGLPTGGMTGRTDGRAGTAGIAGGGGSTSSRSETSSEVSMVSVGFLGSSASSSPSASMASTRDASAFARSLITPWEGRSTDASDDASPASSSGGVPNR